MPKYILFTEAAAVKYKNGINVSNNIAGMNLPVEKMSGDAGDYYIITNWDIDENGFKDLKVNPNVDGYTFKYFNTASAANSNLVMTKKLSMNDIVPGKYNICFDFYSVYNNTTTPRNYCTCKVIVKDENDNITESYSFGNNNTASLTRGLSTLNEIELMGLTEDECEKVVRYEDNYWGLYNDIKTKLINEVSNNEQELTDTEVEEKVENILSNEEIFYLPKFNIKAGQQLTDPIISKSINAFINAGKYNFTQELTIKKDYTIEIELGKEWGNKYTYSIINAPKLILYPFRKV